MRDLRIIVRVDSNQATSELAKVDRSLDKTGAEAEQLDKTFGITGKGIAKTLAGVAVALAALDLVGITKRAVDNASKIQDAMERMGIKSAAAVQKLGFAASQGGASLQTVDTAIKEMAKSLTGDKAAEKLIESFGLTLQDLREGKPEDTFLTLTDAVKKIPNPMEQAKASMVLFGRSGTELLPAIKAGFREVGEQAPLMSDAVVAMGAKAGNQMDRMRGKFEALEARALLPFANFFLTSLPDSVQVGTLAVSQFLPSLETLTLGIIAAGGPRVVLAGLATFFSTTLPASIAVTTASISGMLGPIGLAVGALGLLYAASQRYHIANNRTVESLQAEIDQLHKVGGAMALSRAQSLMSELAKRKEADATTDLVTALQPLPAAFQALTPAVRQNVVVTQDAATATASLTRGYNELFATLADAEQRRWAANGVAEMRAVRVEAEAMAMALRHATAVWLELRNEATTSGFFLDPPKDFGQDLERTLGLFTSLVDGAKTSLQGLWVGISGGNGLAGVFTNLGKGIMDGFGMLLSGGITSLVNLGVSAAIQGIGKLGSWIGGLFGQSKENQHRDDILKQWSGTGVLDAASDKIRKLGFAAGVSDEEMRSLFSVKKVDEFDRIFTSVTDQIAKFNLKAADSIALMKEELATPVVIPVTFGMINPGLGGGSGNDAWSPWNFASYDDWLQNFLSRNPGDEHRAIEGLGGENPWGGAQHFATGGPVPGRGPVRAIVHGGEGVLNPRGMAALDALNRGAGGLSTRVLEKAVQATNAGIEALRREMRSDRQTFTLELVSALRTRG